MIMCAITMETEKVFDPNVVLRICVMEQKKINVMQALAVGKNVINGIIFIFGVGRNHVYTNFRVLGFEFWKIAQLYRKGNALKIEGSLVIDVTVHALDVTRLGRMECRQNGPFEAAIIAVLHVNHCLFLENISWCGNVTATCKRAKFCDNESKLKNKVKYESAPARIEVFDASEKIVEKLVEIELVPGRDHLSM